MIFKRKKLEEGQLYFMHFQSSYRSYVAFGVNLNKMAKNIIEKYNTFCRPQYKTTLEKMAWDALEDDYMFHVSIIDLNTAAAEEYWEFGEYESYDEYNERVLGDYLEVVRKRTKKPN